MKPATFDKLVEKIHQGVDPYAGFPVEQWPADGAGWGSEHSWFYTLIDELQPEVIIEVGSYLGRSARYMAARLKEQQRDSAIVCVDTWLAEHILWTSTEHRPSLRMRHGRPEYYNVFMANTLAAGLQDYIVPLPMPSVAAARLLKVLDIRARLIYIDGSHEAGDVYRDLVFYYDLVLEPGGALLIDDYNFIHLDMMRGLLRDVHRFCAERGLGFYVSGWKALVYKPGGAPPAGYGPLISPQAGQMLLTIIAEPDLAQTLLEHLDQLDAGLLHLIQQNAASAKAIGSADAPQWESLGAGLEGIVAQLAARKPAPPAGSAGGNPGNV